MNSGAPRPPGFPAQVLGRLLCPHPSAESTRPKSSGLPSPQGAPLSAETPLEMLIKVNATAGAGPVCRGQGGQGRAGESMQAPTGVKNSRPHQAREDQLQESGEWNRKHGNAEGTG